MNPKELNKETADNASQAYKVILQSDYDTEEAYFTEVIQFIDNYFTGSKSTPAKQRNDLTRLCYTKKYGGLNTEIHVNTDFDLACVTLEYRFLVDLPYDRLPLFHDILNDINCTLRYIGFFIDETRPVAKYSFNILGAFSESAFLLPMDLINISLIFNACKFRYLTRKEIDPEYAEQAVHLTEGILSHLPLPSEIPPEMELLEQALLAAGKPVTERAKKLLALLLSESPE